MMPMTSNFVILSWGLLKEPGSSVHSAKRTPKHSEQFTTELKKLVNTFELKLLWQGVVQIVQLCVWRQTVGDVGPPGI